MSCNIFLSFLQYPQDNHSEIFDLSVYGYLENINKKAPVKHLADGVHYCASSIYIYDNSIHMSIGEKKSRIYRKFIWDLHQ